MDSVVPVPADAAPHVAVAEPQAHPVAVANAVEAPPLEAVNPQIGEIRDQPAREGVDGRPRRAVRPLVRLAKCYTQALAWKQRKKN